MSKIVVLLPIKNNSQRVIGKNFRDFNGKPLFTHILDTLLKIECISKIIINTDSNLLIDYFKSRPNKRIYIHKRPPEICGDDVSMNEVIKYDLNLSSEEYFLQTHTTNPLLKPDTIENGIKKYFKNLNRYDSLFTVNKYQSRFYNHKVIPLNHDPDHLIKTQDLNPVYEENSNFYIFSKKSFLDANFNRIGQAPLMFPTPLSESIDIDTYEDFLFAENIQKIYLYESEK